MNNRYAVFFIVFSLFASCTPVKNFFSKIFHKNPPVKSNMDSVVVNPSSRSAFLNDLLKQYPLYFDSLLEKKDEYRLQIIYTQIDRGRNKMPRFTDYYFNENPNQYFYPASTVKFPIAVLALQKLNELNIPGLDMNTTMITETAFSGQTAVYNDPTSPDGRPTIAQYIKKILLVSDNDASNRLYEFLGQEYINNTLAKMGFKDVQILHRLQISLTEEENRNTNPIRFLDSLGNVIYEKPAEKSHLVYKKRDVKLGKGYYSGGELKEGPFDFSMKNQLTVESLHELMKSVMFPEAVSRKQRFELKKEDYDFLRKYLSMYCTESKFPTYPTPDYWENYVKFLFYGAEKVKPEPAIRIFNKVGDAYGFLTEVAYIADFEKGIEFLLTATIYCNSDGIFNDDKYDYDTIGLPFMKNLGRVIYEYELKREKKNIPDLSTIKFNYTE